MDIEAAEKSIRKRLETAIAEIEHDLPVAGQLVLVRAVDGPGTAWIGHVVFTEGPAQ